VVRGDCALRYRMGNVTNVSEVYASSVFRAVFDPTRTGRKVATGTRSTGQQNHWTRISYRAALFRDWTAAPPPRRPVGPNSGYTLTLTQPPHFDHQSGCIMYLRNVNITAPQTPKSRISNTTSLFP
jgi:hypothetical protein